MRDYNEMADAVFRRRDEFVAARKKKVGIMLKAGVPVCSLLLITLLGVTLWQGGRLPEIPTETKPAQTLVAQETTIEENTKEPLYVYSEDATVTDPADENSNAGNNNTSQSAPGVNSGGSNSGSGNSTSDNKPNNNPGNKPSNKPSGDNSVSDGIAGGTSGGDRPATGGNSSGDAHWKPQGSATKPAVDDAEPPLEGGDESDTPAIPVDPKPEDPRETQVVEATTVCTETDGPAQTNPAQTDPIEKPPVVTQPATGPAEIIFDGKTYEAQTGDKITVVAKIQTEGFVRDAEAKFNYSAGNLKFVDLEDYGFTDHQLRKAHFPKIDDASAYINDYHSYNGECNVRASFHANTGGISFGEKTVFVTFDYIVTRAGAGEIKPVFLIYFEEGYENSAYTFEVELMVTPMGEVVTPTPPKEEDNTQEEPFTYPEESRDGDLVINCGDRVYSANVGDTVTYVVEIEMDEMFEDIQLEVRYGDGSLEFIRPDKSRENFPEMYGYTVGYAPYLNRLRLVGSDIYGFDFTKRKVLITMDFVVAQAGEIDVELEIEEMNLYLTSNTVFTNSQLVNPDVIDIYQYILVK